MITDPTKHPKFRHITTPYEHQRHEFEKSREWKKYAFFWEMGTGKTKPLLDTAVWLFLSGEIDGLLVISDKGSYRNWPIEEIPRHVDPELNKRVAVYGSAMSSREARLVENIMTAENDCLDILCLNVEALSSKRGYEIAKRFLEGHYGMTVIDESTSIKNSTSIRARAAHALGRMSEYRRIATGTPVTQGPLDLYSQCEFLEPGLLGHRSFVSFRSQYAIMREVTMGTRRFKTVAGYCNQDELALKVKQFSSRLTKAECLDLPDKVYETQYVEMSPEQARIYKQLKDEAVVMLQSGMLSSTNAITTIEKLHQICCGHVKDDDGNITDLPNGRMEVLLDMVENTGKKTIIWCHYQRDVELVMQALAERFPDTYAVHYYGKTTSDERVRALDRFINDPKCMQWVGSPATGGKGITIVCTNQVIYYSCGYNLEHRLQSEDRCHRIGQVNKVTYTDLTTVGTIEQKILKALRDKKQLAHDLLDRDRLLDLLS